MLHAHSHHRARRGPRATREVHGSAQQMHEMSTFDPLHLQRRPFSVSRWLYYVIIA